MRGGGALAHYSPSFEGSATMYESTVVVDKLATTEAAAGDGAMPQPVIEPLTNDLTRRSLDALSLPNSRDEDGDWFTVIPGGDGRSDLVCFFIIYGQNRKMFHLVCMFDAKIPKRKWGAALQLCNAYHAEARFGRA